jgi:hypothetical protein
MGNVARGWIDTDQHGIPCERKRHAGHPEPIDRGVIEFVAGDQKLIFCEVWCNARSRRNPAPAGSRLIGGCR